MKTTRKHMHTCNGTLRIRLLIAVFFIAISFWSCQSEQKYKIKDLNLNASTNQAYLELSIEERRNPKNATTSFVTSEGLRTTLFASEPSIINPTNIDVDQNGRVWVIESPNYSKSSKNGVKPKGRITILEDTDFDGKSDVSKVYYEGEDVNIALGIAVLGNKVYVVRSPDILVFTDDDGDDIPDRIEKLFTGLGNPGDHSAHALTFGPDGKLYWNMGNQAGSVKDRDGNQVLDKYRKPVIQNGDDFIGGMIFRCNQDGSDFEVLAHNFRNNYEVAVDSYGNIWQSDNDDDGNKACRINFIFEHGNYGYLDEISRESWSSYRTNIEKNIEDRHWHQNDPGVIPNVLITGAGSPAGIMVYEGEHLPSKYHGKIFHADAGPNVVRVYNPKESGAGFNASSEDLVKSSADKWFRPIDVATAPDGSVFVADWYDPGVGGGAASDFSKGRIFRISNPNSKYQIEKTNTSTIDGAIEALMSPNLSRRYLGWTRLHSMGSKAEEKLDSLYQSENQIFRARALWLLSKIKGKEKYYLQRASKDANAAIRVTAVRAARQANINYLDFVLPLVRDSSLAVRSELAIGLYPYKNKKASNIWSLLALQHNGQDRWYLEALGIGASNNWGNCLNDYLNLIDNEDSNIAGYHDIVWRSRNEATLPLLVDIIKSKNISNEERKRFFRAFDFLDYKTKQKFLLELLIVEHEDAEFIQKLTLQHINPKEITLTPEVKEVLLKTLNKINGTLEYVNLVDKFGLIEERQNLLTVFLYQPNTEVGLKASKLLIDSRFNAQELLLKSIRNDDSLGIKIVESIGHHGGSKKSLELLIEVINSKEFSYDIKYEVVNSLGESWGGESALLELVKSDKWDKKFDQVAASVLFNVYRSDIQNQAANYLKRPENIEGKPLSSIRDLVASLGNIEDGKEVFRKYCAICHMVNEEGTNFGPKLSEIGSKLLKEGLYNAILYPDQGINYDYEGLQIKLKDGSMLVGLLESETEDAITLKQMGGESNKILKSEIISKEKLPKSLMPNLTVIMKESELIDLIEYLSSLVKI